MTLKVDRWVSFDVSKGNSTQIQMSSHVTNVDTRSFGCHYFIWTSIFSNWFESYIFRTGFVNLSLCSRGLWLNTFAANERGFPSARACKPDNNSPQALLTHAFQLSILLLLLANRVFPSSSFSSFYSSFVVPFRYEIRRHPLLVPYHLFGRLSFSLLYHVPVMLTQLVAAWDCHLIALIVFHANFW